MPRFFRGPKGFATQGMRVNIWFYNIIYYDTCIPCIQYIKYNLDRKNKMFKLLIRVIKIFMMLNPRRRRGLVRPSSSSRGQNTKDVVTTDIPYRYTAATAHMVTGRFLCRTEEIFNPRIIYRPSMWWTKFRLIQHVCVIITIGSWNVICYYVLFISCI